MSDERNEFGRSSRGVSKSALSVAEEQARDAFLDWRRGVLAERIIREALPEDTPLEFGDAVVEGFSAEEWRDFVREGGNVRAANDPEIAKEIEAKIQEGRDRARIDYDEEWGTAEERIRAKFENARDLAAHEYALREMSLKHWREMPAVEALVNGKLGRGAVRYERVGELSVDPFLKSLFEGASGGVTALAKIKMLNAYRANQEHAADTLKWAHENNHLNDFEVKRIKDHDLDAREVIGSFIVADQMAAQSNPQPD